MTHDQLTAAANSATYEDIATAAMAVNHETAQAIASGPDAVSELADAINGDRQFVPDGTPRGDLAALIAHHWARWACWAIHSEAEGNGPWGGAALPEPPPVSHRW